MVPRFLVFGFVFVIGLLGGDGARVYSQVISKEAEQKIDSLNLAAKHLRQNAEFFANFDFSRGKAESWDQAIKLAEESTPICSGTFVKLGENMLYQHDCTDPPFTPRRLLSFGGLEFSFDPRAEGAQLVTPEAAGQLGLFVSSQDDALEMSTFFQMGGQYPKLIEVPETEDKTKSNTTCEIDTSEPDVITVSLDTQSSLMDAHSSSRFRFRIIDGVPLLEEREYLVTKDGQPLTHSKIMMSGFVPCGDVTIASKLVRIMGPLKGANGKQTFRFWTWSSEDLGRKVPQASDLQLKIDKSLRLRQGWDYPKDGIVNEAVLRRWYQSVRDDQADTGDLSTADSELNQDATSSANVSSPSQDWTASSYVSVAVVFLILTGIIFLFLKKASG